MGTAPKKQEKAAKDREKTARGLFSSGFSVVFFCILTPGKIIVVGLKIAVIQLYSSFKVIS